MKTIRKVALCIMSVGLLAGCNQNSNDRGAIHSVILTTPGGTSGELEQSFSGTIEEGREVGVAFRTSGQIERVYVKEDAYVNSGQLIAELDVTDYQLDLEATQIEYDKTKREVARLRTLYEGNSLSGNDYDQACAGLEQLGVSLQNKKNTVGYCKVYSPTSGYVRKVNYEAGEMISAGTPVVTLLDVAQMEVNVNIPAALYAQRSRFENWTCQAGSETVSLSLLGITPKADNNQLYKVRLGIQSALSKQMAGQNVSVTLRLTPTDESECLTLPLSAVQHADEQTFVWIYNEADSIVSKQAVETGEAEGSTITIKSGLSGSEQVVKAGGNYLHEGEKVKLANPKSISNVGDLI